MIYQMIYQIYQWSVKALEEYLAISELVEVALTQKSSLRVTVAVQGEEEAGCSQSHWSKHEKDRKAMRKAMTISLDQLQVEKRTQET